MIRATCHTVDLRVRGERAGSHGVARCEPARGGGPDPSPTRNRGPWQLSQGSPRRRQAMRRFGSMTRKRGFEGALSPIFNTTGSC